MPFTTEWIEPEVALEHEGVTIYHLYSDDDYDQGRMTYWYTLNKDCEWGVCSCVFPEDGDANGCRARFDVRSLPTYDGQTREALLKAIEQGIIEEKGTGKVCR